jgi:hypothetical protein
MALCVFVESQSSHLTPSPAAARASPELGSQQKHSRLRMSSESVFRLSILKKNAQVQKGRQGNKTVVF